MKKILSLALIITMVFSMMTIGMTATAAETIAIEIDGKTISSDVAPVVENGTTLVPVRVITENLGATVTWNPVKQQATVKTAGYNVVFTIGSKNFTVNGTTKSLLLPAKLINNRTMIPLRALAEAIGAEVDYNAAQNKAIIKYFSTMDGSIKISGSTTVFPIMQAVADKLMAMNKGLTITVAGGGSGAGIKDAQNGSNNIGMSSRELTADETAKLNPVSIALDGIAIIVHPKNPVKSLTKEQATKIFLGEITNWKDVGGANAPIFVQTRETGSGTLATLEEMLLSKKKVVATASPFTSSALLKQAVAKSENSIGFDSIGYVDSTVKAIALNNVTPTPTTVQNGSYALSRSLYVLTKGNATGINAKLIDYMCTQDCQTNIVAKEGYVAIAK
ncbi:MAG: phosphate ABC transporter substrate-binding protein PstS family protein [Eubacteriales bacterium]